MSNQTALHKSQGRRLTAGHRGSRSGGWWWRGDRLASRLAARRWSAGGWSLIEFDGDSFEESFYRAALVIVLVARSPILLNQYCFIIEL